MTMDIISRDFIDVFEKKIVYSKNICIVSHFHPDGDAVGSACGLFHYINAINGNVDVILPSTYNSNLEFLDKKNFINIYGVDNNTNQKIEEKLKKADLIIGIDFNGLSRLNDISNKVKESKAYKILIDHHPSPEKESFDLICSDPTRSSASELLFHILMRTSAINGEIQKLSKESAEAIATGIITDTNNFNNSTTAPTFEAAAALTNYGISLERIKNLTFGGFSEERMRLMGDLLLNEMKIIKEHGVAFMILSLKKQHEYNYITGDSEGIVNLALNIKGIKFSAFFTESDENIRVSLRSNEEVSVNDFSRKYCNGGGHERAAGGKLEMPIEEVAGYFIKSINEYFKK